MRMNERRRWFVMLLAVGATLPLAAQKTTQIHPGKGGSPHVRTEWVLGGANLSIEYGRPYLKGRTIGKDVEPMPGRVWRAGADEATTLKTDADLEMGTTIVPAGSYTLWVLTDAEGRWTLIVNKQTGQWGTMYDEKQDLARLAMQVTKRDKSVEQLTFSIEPMGADRAVLALEWGPYRASVPLAVKKKGA
jgi:hypothetical protein